LSCLVLGSARCPRCHEPQLPQDRRDADRRRRAVGQDRGRPPWPLSHLDDSGRGGHGRPRHRRWI